MGKLVWNPLTPDRWEDFETLFGPNGACGGCWCMWWRITRAEFERRKGEANRQAMKAIVGGGEVPGILAYHERRPIGWCSVAPRAVFHSLNRSPVLKPLDDIPVWSLPCFYVPREHRGQGLMGFLMEAACEYVRGEGGKVVEAYPTAPRGRRLPPASSFMGLPAVFAQAGFVEAARPSSARIIMRRFLTPG
jgi:GNAT superfamily N-acetyltransferase